jgi:hypothetical protein
MKKHAVTEVVTLSGKIVEIDDRNGRSRARISLNPCCIEVAADPAAELHLGDMVAVDAEIRTTVVRPAPALAE